MSDYLRGIIVGLIVGVVVGFFLAIDMHAIDPPCLLNDPPCEVRR